MGFVDATRTCFRKYVTFSGRASRPEFWWFVLFCVLGGIAAAILDDMLFGAGRFETTAAGGTYAFRADANGPIHGLFSLATLLPSIAAGWRRMHDSGRSGLFLVYPLIVIVGILSYAGYAQDLLNVEQGVESALSGVAQLVLALAILVLILSPFLVLWWLTRPSQPRPNKYGPNPYEVTP